MTGHGSLVVTGVLAGLVCEPEGKKLARSTDGDGLP